MNCNLTETRGYLKIFVKRGWIAGVTAFKHQQHQQKYFCNMLIAKYLIEI